MFLYYSKRNLHQREIYTKNQQDVSLLFQEKFTPKLQQEVQPYLALESSR